MYVEKNDRNRRPYLLWMLNRCVLNDGWVTSVNAELMSLIIITHHQPVYLWVGIVSSLLTTESPALKCPVLHSWYSLYCWMNKLKLETTLIKIWFLCSEYVFSVLEEVTMYAVSIFKSSLYLNLVIFLHPSIFKFYLLTFFPILLLPPFLPPFFPSHTAYFRNFNSISNCSGNRISFLPIYR